MKARVFICIVIGLLLTGCWDSVEIEERAFVITLGLDKNTEDDMQVTYSMPNIMIIAGKGGSGEKKFDKVAYGKCMIEAEREFAKKSSMKLSPEHLKMIVYGKEFLENPKLLKRANDYMVRNAKFARNIVVVATDMSANELVTSKPKSTKLPGEYIRGLVSGAENDGENLYKTDLGKFVNELETTEGISILPVINFENDEFIIEGIVVIDDYKKSIRLDNQETKIYNWLVGKGAGSLIEFNYKNEGLTYEITELKREVEVEMKSNILQVHMYIETEGEVNSFITEKDEDLIEDQTIKKLEEAMNSSMLKDASLIIQTVQTEVGKDIIGLEKVLKLKNQFLWKEIKEDWSDYFKSAVIKVEVNNKIRRIGMIH